MGVVAVSDLSDRGQHRHGGRVNAGHRRNPFTILMRVMGFLGTVYVSGSGYGDERPHDPVRKLSNAREVVPATPLMLASSLRASLREADTSLKQAGQVGSPGPGHRLGMNAPETGNVAPPSPPRQVRSGSGHKPCAIARNTDGIAFIGQSRDSPVCWPILGRKFALFANSPARKTRSKTAAQSVERSCPSAPILSGLPGTGTILF